MKKSRPKSSLSNRQPLTTPQLDVKYNNKNKKEQEQQSAPKIQSFPHSTPPKDYRINQLDVYNYVRNSVHDTFKLKTTRNYELSQIPQHNQLIDRLCKKYSILRSNKRSVFENAEINIEQITKRYVRSRSKQKQKQQIKQRLKKDISQNYKFGPNRQYQVAQQFFSFDGNNLRNLQKRYEDKQRCSNLYNTKKNKAEKDINRHPYLQLYQNAQVEALRDLNNKKKLQLMTHQYPTIPQPQEWQKNTHFVQKMVKQARQNKKRLVQSARTRNSVKNSSVQNFFLS